jgi:cytochrome c oxidase assembly protein subunit 15
MLLAGSIFPLIWVGGLVTTYDAGMAVPDWPTTYGYNLFLYPWQTWLFGPWDLFIEHGHRLLAATVGLVTIALVIVLYRFERRTWVRRLGLAALALVLFQGWLGGMRVRMDARLLAQIHGCVGPAFFALGAALAVFTSPRWRTTETSKLLADRRVARLASITTALAYLQLVLGSQVRHVSLRSDMTVFRAAVLLHLFMAAMVALHAFLLLARVRSSGCREAWLSRPAWRLAALVVAQLGLGCGTWVLKYGWPAWLPESSWTAGYVVTRESLLQASVTTAHVAIGSLIFVTSLIVALRAWRLSSMPFRSGAAPMLKWETAP